MSGEAGLGEDSAAASAEDRPTHRHIDTENPHPARRYNYWLGGKDNFAVDRQSGDEIESFFPTVRLAALENRAFMRRAVTFMAKEAGIRQFLDIGTGIPAPDNTHEVAQAIAPESRVVYVDNDPIVMSHARALLQGSPLGATAYIEADLRDYERILDHPTLRDTLDLTQPVGLLLVAILHFVGPQDDAHRIVARLADALPSGSHVVISHATADFADPALVAASNTPRPPAGMYTRSKPELAALLAGLTLVEPGIVGTVDWRSENESQPRPTAQAGGLYGAVAYK